MDIKTFEISHLDVYQFCGGTICTLIKYAVTPLLNVFNDHWITVYFIEDARIKCFYQQILHLFFILQISGHIFNKLNINK